MARSAHTGLPWPSGGADGAVRLWDATDLGTSPGASPPSDSANFVASLASARTAHTGHGNSAGVIQLWNVADQVRVRQQLASR